MDADRADRHRQRGLGHTCRASASASSPALTPREHEVIYTDDVVRPFDLERDVKDVDLVGISVDSKTARRSYEIAAAYRRRGVKVVMGGIHATACPEEALRFADSVVVSEAEDAWPDAARRLRARRAEAHLPPRAARSRAAARRAPRPLPLEEVHPLPGGADHRAAAPTRASSAASRPQTARPSASAPADEVLAELEDARQAHPVRRRQRDDPPRLRAGALHAHGAAEEALDRPVLARRRSSASRT